MSRYQKKTLLLAAFDRDPGKFGMHPSDRRFFINMMTMATDKELNELLDRILK